MIYGHDDVVTTKDGVRHRVLWSAGTDKLWVKSADDKHNKKKYKIKIANITQHDKRGYGHG